MSEAAQLLVKRSHGLEQFVESIQDSTGLTILDGGGICQDNVSFLTSLGHRLYSEDLLRARADTWIQVRERSSGSVLFNRVLRPGETYRAPDRAGLVMTTGNAGGLEVSVEGETLPSLGGQGVVRRDLPLEPAALRQAVAALPR